MNSEATLKHINIRLERWKKRVLDGDTEPRGRAILITHITQMLEVRKVLTGKEQLTTGEFIYEGKTKP